MVSIAKHIAHLLYLHDCVVIPDVGGFVAWHVPGHVDMGKSIALPPAKEIQFNPKLKHNDGLLAHEIAVRESISYTEALEQINAFKEELDNQIQTNKRYDLGDWGQLYIDHRNALRFRGKGSNNFNLNAFGLEPVSLIRLPELQAEQPKKKENVTPVLNVVKRDEPIVQEEKALPAASQGTAPEPSPSRKKIWYGVAAACLLPVAFYSFWIPLKTDALETGTLRIDHLNPFKHSNERSALDYQLRDAVTLPSPDIEEFDQATAQTIVEELLALKKDDPDPVTEPNKPVSRSGPYFAMVGAFSNPSNADRMILELQEQGHDAFIVDVVNGLSRIAIASFESKEFATKGLRQLQVSGFPDAWLLVKR